MSSTQFVCFLSVVCRYDRLSPENVEKDEIAARHFLRVPRLQNSEVKMCMLLSRSRARATVAIEISCTTTSLNNPIHVAATSSCIAASQLIIKDGHDGGTQISPDHKAQ